MFFFVIGGTNKLIGREVVKINKNGFMVNAEVKVYRSFISLFFIPLIPIGKRYSIYIPHSDEYYESRFPKKINKMPEDLLEICKEVGRHY